VVIEKRFVDRKPQTRIRASSDGRRAFNAHVAYLKHVLESAQ